MNYIIMDMEWNQPMSPAKTVRTPVLLNAEIIQIGAYKTDENFNLIDKIKINVRPKFYKQMNPHVEKITGITSIQLTAGETFPQAFKRFKLWCGEDFRFITWGFDDLGVLEDNLAVHGLDTSYGSDYINLQLIYDKQVEAEHLQMGLSAAAEKLEIPINVHVHDALNDAYLTYEICRRLDMALGIAEYAEYAAAVPSALFKDTVNNISDPKKMLSDPNVMKIACPNCREPLSYREWLFGSYRSCKAIADCAKCGGLFQVKLKASMISERNFTVVRSVYKADKSDVEAFEEKIQKRDERRRAAIEKRKNDT